MTGVRSQGAGDRSQESGDRRQESGDRGQESVKTKSYENTFCLIASFPDFLQENLFRLNCYKFLNSHLGFIVADVIPVTLFHQKHLPVGCKFLFISIVRDKGVKQ